MPPFLPARQLLQGHFISKIAAIRVILVPDIDVIPVSRQLAWRLHMSILIVPISNPRKMHQYFFKDVKLKVVFLLPLMPFSPSVIPCSIILPKGLLVQVGTVGALKQMLSMVPVPGRWSSVVKDDGGRFACFYADVLFR